MKDHVKEAKQIISSNIYMTIASASKSGKPWVSPVFFAYDNRYNLYWVSNKDSKHSILLSKNHSAAIVIFDSRALEGEGDGVYFETKVKELKEKGEIEKAMKILNERITKEEFRIKKIDEVISKGVWRIYKAIPNNVFKLTEGEVIDGQYVDKKIKIKLI